VRGNAKNVAGAAECRGVGALLFCLLAAAGRADDVQPPSNAAWEIQRAEFYGNRPMGLVDDGYMSLTVPANTPDPAATPLMLRFAHDDQRPITRVRVFVDNNPSPLVATLDFAKSTPVTEIDMRVRIDRFTSVRAVAETADGGLEMRSSWVKASGGCSAPPSPTAGGVVGEIRLRPSPDARSMQVSIRHPNNSGFQIDPRTGEPIPPHYISHLRVTAGGATVLDAQTGISVSENPSLRVAFDSPLARPVMIDAVDSETKSHFTATWDGGTRAAPAAAKLGTAADGRR
jgi:sulfur-oxidizing protein SoxY